MTNQLMRYIINQNRYLIISHTLYSVKKIIALIIDYAASNLICFFERLIVQLYIFLDLIIFLNQMICHKMLEIRNPFLILLFALFLNIVFSIVDNNISHPRVYTNKQIMISRIEAQDRKFSISFPNINYQLNGQVYQTQKNLQGEEVYDIKNYNKSESCVFYKTNFNLNVDYGIDLDYIAENSFILQEEQVIYVIGYYEPTDYSIPVERFLKIYSFTNSQINQIETKSLGQTLLKMGFEQQSYMVGFNSTIFISDGNTMYQTKASRSSQQSLILVQGLNSNENTFDFQFLGMTIEDNNSLILLYQNKIAIYSLVFENNVYKLSLITELKKGDKLIYDVQFSKNQIFVLSQNILKIYNKSSLSTSIDIELEGETCSRIYLYGDVLQIVCTYKQIIYVAEYQYDSIRQQITLNRYYNQLNDYRLVQFLGEDHDKILMIGDDQIILTNFAINREILMDLEDGNSNSEAIYSFGVQKIQTLKNYSNQMTTTTIGVAQDYIVILKLDQIPPQIQCDLKSPDFSSLNLLVVSNTSKCQFNNEQSPLASICTNLKPIQIFISAIQIQKKMSVLVILLIVILILVIILLCLGWIFNVNLNHKRLIQKIKNKIKKIKSSNKEMKQI